MTCFRLTLASLAVTLCVLFSGCQKQQESSAQKPADPTYQGTIAAVGDSLTAGLGVNESDAYPAQLQRKLQQNGYHWRVINAGISGETTSGTLSRLNWVLKLKPDVVVLEIGANDGLRGIDTELARKNIEKIVTTLQSKGVVVVLAGMQMLRNLGTDYTGRFMAIYPKVAKEHHLILIPFFLTNVAGDPNLNQQDEIHPTAKGYAIVTDTVYPYVVKAIHQKQSGKTR